MVPILFYAIFCNLPDGLRCLEKIIYAGFE